MDLTKFNTATTDGDAKAQFQIAGNIFVKLMVLAKAGDRIFGHVHTYDHITLIATGTVIMKQGAKETLIEAPQLVITPAGLKHEFVCILPALVCCTHAIRDGADEHDVADVSITPKEGLALMGQFPLADS